MCSVELVRVEQMCKDALAFADHRPDRLMMDHRIHLKNPRIKSRFCDKSNDVFPLKSFPFQSIHAEQTMSWKSSNVSILNEVVNIIRKNVCCIHFLGKRITLSLTSSSTPPYWQRQKDDDNLLKDNDDVVNKMRGQCTLEVRQAVHFSKEISFGIFRRNPLFNWLHWRYWRLMLTWTSILLYFCSVFTLVFKSNNLFILIMHTSPVDDDDMKAYLKSNTVLIKSI